MLVHFLHNFEIKRTDVPLRMHAIFLYEPVDEKLVYLVPKENKVWKFWYKIIYFYYSVNLHFYDEIFDKSINLRNTNQLNQIISLLLTYPSVSGYSGNSTFSKY